MKTPRVKQILKVYQKNGLTEVYSYLTQEDMVVDPESWAGQIKQLIENKYYYTAKTSIETLLYKFLKPNTNDKE